MDGPAFDRIARLWGTRTGRRRALCFIGSGILVISWLGRGKTGVAQSSVAQRTCTQDADCADRYADSCTGAACVDGLCTFFIVSCIPGASCCGNGECCPVGEPSGCLADTDCSPASGDPCEGVRCEDGQCVPFLVACAPDFACCGRGACCPTDGGCIVDGDCGALPSPWDAGTRCIGGVCVPSFTSN